MRCIPDEPQPLLDWFTPQAKDAVKHIAFTFANSPRRKHEPYFGIDHLRISYESLERRLRSFTHLEGLYLILGDEDWRRHSGEGIVMGSGIPAREHPVWKRFIDYVESMKNLSGRPTVKVEFGNRDSFEGWVDSHRSTEAYD